jgi:DNA helicase-2/ATP-dependent DNA helicase PcrA
MELPRVEMQVAGPAPSAGPAWDTSFAETAPFDAQEDEVDWSSQLDTEFNPPELQSPAKSATKQPLAPLTTAAELQRTKKRDAPQVEPEAFHQGMVVRHPEYGLGKIIALGGAGAARKATVLFASEAGEKNFVLAKSPLRPAKSGP